jgi:hypothetical protein
LANGALDSVTPFPLPEVCLEGYVSRGSVRNVRLRAMIEEH